jgi:hypothetical protein
MLLRGGSTHGIKRSTHHPHFLQGDHHQKISLFEKLTIMDFLLSSSSASSIDMPPLVVDHDHHDQQQQHSVSNQKKTTKRAWSSSWLFHARNASRTPAFVPMKRSNNHRRDDCYNAPPAVVASGMTEEDTLLTREIVFVQQQQVPPEADADSYSQNLEYEEQEEDQLVSFPPLVLSRGGASLFGPAAWLNLLVEESSEHRVDDVDELSETTDDDIESFVLALQNFRHQNNTSNENTTISTRQQCILAMIVSLSMILFIAVAVVDPAEYTPAADTSQDDDDVSDGGVALKQLWGLWGLCWGVAQSCVTRLLGHVGL